MRTWIYNGIEIRAEAHAIDARGEWCRVGDDAARHETLASNRLQRALGECAFFHGATVADVANRPNSRLVPRRMPRIRQ
jgi:hypothetical protein